MSFSEVARQIIDETIFSALCIDDEFSEPYEPIVDGLNRDKPSRLYSTFRENGCSIEIYRYRGQEEWNQYHNHLLKNVDLLILDWQLKDGGIRFEDSLSILTKAVDNDSLPFVLIYTSVEDLNLVDQHITAYFSGTTEADSKASFETLAQSLEETEIVDDADKFFESISVPLLELILDSQSHLASFKADLRGRLNQNYGQFCRAMNEAFQEGDLDAKLVVLGHVLNESHFGNADSERVCKRIDEREHTFLVENTLISISNKKELKPEDVYSGFASIVSAHPQNFVAVLSLELRNQIRDNNLTIDHQLKTLNELAFFHHRSRLPEPVDFENLMKSTWKEQLSSFIMYQSPKTLAEIPDYLDTKAIDQDKLVNFCQEADEAHTALGKLNHYYSTLNIKRTDNDLIRFGDVFLLEHHPVQGDQSNEFLLCITPHCDCVRPEKVNHNLFFVKGGKINLSQALTKADTGFISYLLEDDMPIAIEWNPKPFTLFIPREQNNIHIAISVTYMAQDRRLIFRSTQKENHTQRVANEAMGYAIRVGIDLAGIDAPEE